MTKPSDRSPVKPWRVAIFNDVPAVLDSLWRWADFRTNQVGCVDLTSDRFEFRAKAGWRTPAFALYVLVSMFLAYGPTADALCTAVGLSAYQLARQLLGWALQVVAFLVFLTVFNAALLKLAVVLENERNGA